MRHFGWFSNTFFDFLKFKMWQFLGILLIQDIFDVCIHFCQVRFYKVQIEYEVDLLPNMALKVLRKENSKKNMVFIEMENRQKYITLMFKLVLKMSHLHLAILAFSPILAIKIDLYGNTVFNFHTSHIVWKLLKKSHFNFIIFVL